LEEGEEDAHFLAKLKNRGPEVGGQSIEVEAEARHLAEFRRSQNSDANKFGQRAGDLSVLF